MLISDIGFSLSSLFTEILRLKKISITFKPVIPITYSKSGGKYLLETITKLCGTNFF